MAFIALKPVRFDKEYAVGDVISESVVDLKRRKFLSDKIVEVPEKVVGGLVEDEKLKKVDGAKVKKTSKKKKVKESDEQEKVTSLEVVPEGTGSRSETEDSEESEQDLGDLGEGEED